MDARGLFCFSGHRSEMLEAKKCGREGIVLWAFTPEPVQRCGCFSWPCCFSLNVPKNT